MAETIAVGGLTLRFLHSKDDTSGSLDLFEMTCPPDGRMPVPHYHRDWDETVYGLSGTITFMVDGKPVELGPGDSVFIRRGIVHGFDNRSGAPASCLCVLTPGVLGPAYFRETGAELRPGVAPDPARMRAIMERHGLIPAPPAADGVSR